ncbi:C-type lectin domain family 2 member B-like isoform X2 [Pelodiscus sinensis]|uniref:C-type lectin domain family 2 member B-like isoform X2 n=1 Tax=Pelodiscus sinensis TaxID=13735 RepID=UPI003F6B48BC
MEGTADALEQVPQGEGQPTCNGGPETGGETESGETPQGEQRSLMVSCGNGDARREQNPGRRSPFRTASGTCGLYVLLSSLVIALTIALAVVALRAPVTCSGVWVSFQGKCFYFSEAEGNWTYSRNNCSARGASLAAIDTPQEMAFMLRYRGLSDHWIGLQGEEDQPRRWVNGTEFNNWFKIGGGGECVYLKEGIAISSSRCSMERRWICSAPPGGPKA